MRYDLYIPPTPTSFRLKSNFNLFACRDILDIMLEEFYHHKIYSRIFTNLYHEHHGRIYTPYCIISLILFKHRWGSLELRVAVEDECLKYNIPSLMWVRIWIKFKTLRLKFMVQIKFLSFSFQPFPFSVSDKDRLFVLNDVTMYHVLGQRH